MIPALLENSAATEPWLAGAAGLLAAGTWALGSHLFGRQLEPAVGAPRITPAAANLYKNAVALLVFAVVWAATERCVPGAGRFWQLALSGALGFAIGDALYFAAFPLCGVQLAAMTANLIPPVAALLGFLLFGETIAPLGLACMGVTLAGIWLVMSDRRARERSGRVRDPRARRLGVLFGCLAAVSQAFAIVAGRAGFEGVPVLTGTIARLAGGVACAFLVAVAVGAFRRARTGEGGPVVETQRLARPFALPAIALALLVPTLVAAVFNLPLHSYALGHLRSGVSAIVFATTPLWTLPIGLALGERYGPRTWLGTALGFAGVAGVIQLG